MIQLADQFFETKNDPNQISVTEEVMSQLQKIHPATLSERTNEGGPIVWILVLPTTLPLMEAFVRGTINEHELLDKTPIGASYDAIYLCSALVLPEHRCKGLARSVTIEAVKSIQRDHPIRHLFYWPFSREGEHLAKSIAEELDIPLRERASL